MKINLDVVPKNLNEAVNLLRSSIESVAEEESLKDTDGLHFGLGMYLRNNWSLWERDTVLVQWFKNNLGIAHADDISGTILEAFAANLRGEEFDATAHVKRYIEHWKNMGIDPLNA
jgi:hypothetical protein